MQPVRIHAIRFLGTLSAFFFAAGLAAAGTGSCDVAHRCTFNTTTYYCDDTCSGTGCDISNRTHSSCDDSNCNDGKCVLCISGSGSATIQGTTGDDVVCPEIGVTDAGAGGDNIVTKGGDDQVASGGGADYVDTGDGLDGILGGDGDDILYDGGGVNGSIQGEGGNDELHGGGGTDVLYGGVGDDLLYGDDGDDTLFGDGGNDLLEGGGGADDLYGGAFTCAAGSGNDTLRGGAGNDDLYGCGVRDALDGGANDDTLYSNSADSPDDDVVGSVLCGGLGNDALYGWGPAHQCMDGGDGTDTCDYDYRVTGSPAQQDHDVGTGLSCTASGDTLDSATTPCACP